MARDKRESIWCYGKETPSQAEPPQWLRSTNRPCPYRIYYRIYIYFFVLSGVGAVYRGQRKCSLCDKILHVSNPLSLLVPSSLRCQTAEERDPRRCSSADHVLYAVKLADRQTDRQMFSNQQTDGLTTHQKISRCSVCYILKYTAGCGTNIWW